MSLIYVVLVIVCIQMDVRPVVCYQALVLCGLLRPDLGSIWSVYE